MSDYTQATNFAAKDDLPAGASEKKILGSEWDTEFNAVATAIATKYDSADLSDQSTAEAGTDNTVLNTPLRTAQELAALRVQRLAATMDTYVTKAVLGTDTTVVLAASEAVLFSISVPAAGLYMYNIYLPVATSCDFQVRPDFSGSVTTNACATPYPQSTGGANRAAALPESQSVSMVNTGSNVVHVVGVLLADAAGTLSIYTRATINGDPTNPVVSSAAYCALRRLA